MGNGGIMRYIPIPNEIVTFDMINFNYKHTS